MASSQINVGHFNRLRIDGFYALRVALSMRLGGWNSTEDERMALSILGEKFVIAEESLSKLPLRNPPSMTEKMVPYNERTLRSCARQNDQDGQDWRLVFVSDASREIFNKAGSDFFIRSCSSSGNRSFFRSGPTIGAVVIQGWQDHFSRAGLYGYRLINFNPQFGSVDGQNQTYPQIREAVSRLPGCRIAPAHWVLEAWICHLKITGETELRDEHDGILYHPTHFNVIDDTERRYKHIVALCGMRSGESFRRDGQYLTGGFLIHFYPFTEYCGGGVMIVRDPDF